MIESDLRCIGSYGGIIESEPIALDQVGECESVDFLIETGDSEEYMSIVEDIRLGR